MLVFRLSKVSAIDKLWEMYNDDSFRELLQKLLFSDETGKTTKEQPIEVDLTFVTDVYNKVREELEGKYKYHLQIFCFLFLYFLFARVSLSVLLFRFVLTSVQ